MALKSVLVHVETAQEAWARVRCAADIADRFGARLIGCGCEADPTPRNTPALAGAATETQARLIDTNLRTAEQYFHAACYGVEHEWITERLPPVDAMSLHARAAELIVTSRKPSGRIDPARNDDPGLLVIISGRPVLLAPPEADYLNASRIVVCWKDSREARRALFDALPFLERADDVLILEVTDEADKSAGVDRGAEVAAALRRHGVSCASQVLARKDRRVASLIEEAAAAFGADLIVAGAFGHSRVGEWAFGGVTQSLMEQTRRFVLFSH